MQITFANRKLQKLCSSEKPIKSGLSKSQVRRLRQRLMEIGAAETLADLYTIRTMLCHELAGERKGEYAVNLDEKLRIVFIIANDPEPRLPDGGVDRERVTEIEIVFVGDYHPR